MAALLTRAVQRVFVLCWRFGACSVSVQLLLCYRVSEEGLQGSFCLNPLSVSVHSDIPSRLLSPQCNCQCTWWWYVDEQKCPPWTKEDTFGSRTQYLKYTTQDLEKYARPQTPGGGQSEVEYYSLFLYCKGEFDLD